MNRLILVGNGFDLAHNLKTSYCHFISDYISNAINAFINENIYSDPLLTIRWKYANYRHNGSYPLSTPATAITDFKRLRNENYFVVSFESQFLSSTLHRVQEMNWVDLENEYFDQLLNCKTKADYDFDEVKKLNDEFDFLRNKLEEYLFTHQAESSSMYSENLREIFCEKIKSSDIVTVPISDETPKRILIVSFNYTNTLKKYVEQCSKVINTDLNYIHGELNSQTNPIIFGFGDEYNKSYLEFEELKSKELLKHIKSFGYFKASNYHNLIRFLDIEDYQVFIFGHSLGLSDRTMLRQIFEHNNCKSIKIFYHDRGTNGNDFTDKTFDISSHFTDKGTMRKKIVPFDLSTPMPQPGNSIENVGQ